MSHPHSGCKRLGLRPSMRINLSKADELAAPHQDCGYFSRRTAVSTIHAQTAVLISFDGVLDGQTGRSVSSQVRDLLDLGIRNIFLDLSGVDRVDTKGVQHLIEMLNYADALGGGVALLDGSDVLDAYLRDI
jgi:anti-anti-sigma regulatory factor